MALTSLAEARDEGLHGGKAVQLGMALRAGLPVPAGLALSWSFVERLAEGDASAARELAEAHEAFGPLLFAVRSSAVGEDSSSASFAGQHLTRLAMRGAGEVQRAVREVHASGGTAGALAYRSQLGIAGPPRVGVVIQELIEPDVSGVLFSRHPVTGADELVVEATWGFGEALVAGMVTPDNIRLTREGRVIESRAGEKDLAIRLAPDGGMHEVAVDEALVRAPCLDPAALAALVALARRCDDAFGAPSDLEWALAAGRLHLLQRRGITR